MNVRKAPVSAAQTRALLAKVRKLYVRRGQKMVEIAITVKTDLAKEALPLCLGRSGTLRAPVLLVNQTLIVGFSEEIYRSVLGL